jgi:hypothetical protein
VEQTRSFVDELDRQLCDAFDDVRTAGRLRRLGAQVRPWLSSLRSFLLGVPR